MKFIFLSAVAAGLGFILALFMVWAGIRPMIRTIFVFMDVEMSLMSKCEKKTLTPSSQEWTRWYFKHKLKAMSLMKGSNHFLSMSSTPTAAKCSNQPSFRLNSCAQLRRASSDIKFVQVLVCTSYSPLFGKFLIFGSLNMDNSLRQYKQTDLLHRNANNFTWFEANSDFGYGNH